jgi:hypothetical protein
MGKVSWRGHKFDEQTRDMLREVDKLVGPDIAIRPTQGSYSTSVGASAGTHAGGGAVDLSVGGAGLTAFQVQLVVFLMRRVGFACWHRAPSEGNWASHIHAINKTAPDLSPAAKSQVAAFKKGLSGLASGKADKHKDLDASDTSTWASYRRNWSSR